MLKKLRNTSIVKGFIKAYNIDILPSKVGFYYRSIYNRIFRVIGGLSTLIVISKTLFSFYFLDELIMFLSLVFLLQLLIINIIRFFYGFYLFKYKKEIFEVRNSPLDQAATKWAKLFLCVKYGICAPAAGIATISSVGLAADQIHVYAGGDPYFGPLAGSIWKETYKNLFGEYPKSDLKTLSPGQQISNVNYITDFSQEEINIFSKAKPEERAEFISRVNKSFQIEKDKWFKDKK